MNSIPAALSVRHFICISTIAAAAFSCSPAALAVDPLPLLWKGNAVASKNKWTTNANWFGGASPLAGDALIFDGSSAQTAPLMNFNTMNFNNLSIKSLTFAAGNLSFTTTIIAGSKLRFESGAGIVNSSSKTQTLITAGSTSDLSAGGGLFFHQGSSANVSIFNEAGSTNGGGGFTVFKLDTNAGNSSITNNGGIDGAGGTTYFEGTSSASNSTILNKGAEGASPLLAGTTIFSDNSKAGSVGTITNQAGTVPGASGGILQFQNRASAEGKQIVNEGATLEGAVGGVIAFSNHADAGISNIENHAGNSATKVGGLILFSNNASASGSTIVNDSIVRFYDSSDAGSSMIVSNGSAVTGGFGGSVEFRNQSSAGSSKIIAGGSNVSGGFGGATIFAGNSTAADSTLRAKEGSSGGEGGTIYFTDNALGGTAKVVVEKGGSLDISGSNEGVSVGSIQGAGRIGLGSKTLVTGGRNTDTIFSGRITDGGYKNGNGGNLEKEGIGKLTLAGLNKYTGNTTVTNGKLVVEGSISESQAIFLTNDGRLVLSGIENDGFGRINDEAVLTLETTGGLFLDPSSYISENIGGLSLLSDSIIDFGMGSAMEKLLNFGSFGSSSWVGNLSLLNWSGLLIGNGPDQISFSGLTDDQLAQITFYDDEGHNLGHARFLEGASGEIVPAGVPEPATLLAGAVLLGLIGIGRPGRSSRRA